MRTGADGCTTAISQRNVVVLKDLIAEAINYGMTLVCIILILTAKMLTTSVDDNIKL